VERYGEHWRDAPRVIARRIADAILTAGPADQADDEVDANAPGVPVSQTTGD
jgi:hypothetical protein